MPTSTCDELVATGDDLLKQGKVAHDMELMYGAEEIKKRYDELSGIFRHVLSTSVTKLKEIYVEHRLAIANCDVKGIVMN